jgi:hypothetical protein
VKSPYSDGTGSAAGQRLLNPSPAPDFLDSSHEWRCLFSEAWGTFLLVVVAPGIMVMAIIYFMGCCRRCPFKSGSHIGIRSPGQFSMESDARVYWGAVRGRYRRGLILAGDVRRHRVTRAPQRPGLASAILRR